MTGGKSETQRVLVLQGGGALGSYQAGVFEALADAGLEPHWVAGISIGAINAALIAGNPPERRVDRLREFWCMASDGPQLDFGVPFAPLRAAQSQINAAGALFFGVKGMFEPRVPPPALQPQGTVAALSYYDTAPLKKTLEQLVDFDRINAGDMRFSVGSVNVETGNFAYFDNHSLTITPEHVMASGALPPGLPPIEIDGQYYWDGGLVSNTPLDYVLEEERARDLLVFQVDLFPARGPMPGNLIEVAEREMDIRYSSRTRFNTDQALRVRNARKLVRELLAGLPEDISKGKAARAVAELAAENALTVVHLIYRRRPFEGSSKDFEFSRATMLEHWTSGAEAVKRSMRERAAILACPPAGGVHIFDVRNGEEAKRRA
ncbi:MAG TPA: patatin-like phospholipase family protein [Caulobacteraceae bacterium]